MSQPTEAAYETARAMYDGAVIAHGAYGHRAGHYDAIRAAVDVVWSLARQQAAADIRARAETVPLIPLRRGPRLIANLRPDVTVEWAARIAEGADGG